MLMVVVVVGWGGCVLMAVTVVKVVMVVMVVG